MIQSKYVFGIVTSKTNVNILFDDLSIDTLYDSLENMPSGHDHRV